MSRRPAQNRGPAKRAGAVEPPPDRDAHPLAGPRPPAYVIVLWTMEQLRDRLQRNNAALAQELQDRGQRPHRCTAEPTAEREAEP
jgi:hypothetical protein